ncbi:MAG: methylated-DNA--[protein]-cysteine S-methyltransferase [Saprospiraceae bacterium]|nr:methylated-DNA--[protein]-cysteine S-methyltransferase [Saprospiraceae bacterium]MBL0026238.1 methylated-DNA--[protein]-cysteine S-methyltransferase [Saprospiraceae bacterium]
MARRKERSKYLTPEEISENDFIEIVHTLIGDLCIVASGKGLKAIKLIGEFVPKSKENQFTRATLCQLNEYFIGERTAFDLEFDTGDHSDFANRVWTDLLKIPYGNTISYTQLAARLGDPLCIRAAASANGQNPIPIIIPCHRVIGSDGSLTGFALGLDIKQKLLALENPDRFAIKQIGLFD